MNTLSRVLVGAALVLSLAGLLVGLSNSAQIVNISAGAYNGSLGLIASKWTNFGGSGVATKIGFAITSSDNSTTTQFVVPTGSTAAPFPTILAGDFVQGASGFSPTLTTTTALTAVQFCGTTNFYVPALGSSATMTLPSATSTYAVCGGSTYGGWQNQVITNDSTNSVVFAAGTGVTFKCETQGVGTTSVVGGCTASSVTLNATSVAYSSGFWDNSSATLYILWGNEFH